MRTWSSIPENAPRSNWPGLARYLEEDEGEKKKKQRVRSPILIKQTSFPSHIISDLETPQLNLNLAGIS